MDYRYVGPNTSVTDNYHNTGSYEQPAAQSANYPTDDGYGNYQNSATDYPQQYDYNAQDPNQQAAYQEGEYAAEGTENTEPSLSDYNSHEVCVRMTTKK